MEKNISIILFHNHNEIAKFLKSKLKVDTEQFTPREQSKGRVPECPEGKCD